MGKIKIIKAIFIIVSLSLIFVSGLFYFSMLTIKEIVYDYDFNDARKYWDINSYQENSRKSNININNDIIVIHIVDNVNDSNLCWGFIHQGEYPHGWGKYAYEPPLKNEIVIYPNKDYNNYDLILKIKLKRSKINFLSGNVPQWMEKENHLCHVQIGLALFFEVEGRNYSAPTNIYDTNFQFEITFLRVRLTKNGELIFLDDQLKFRAPEYDNDTHNIYSYYQIGANKWYDFEINLMPYLINSWNLCKELFGNANWIKLRWVNFYVEILNAEIIVEVDHIRLIYRKNLFHKDVIYQSIIITIVLSILLMIIIKYLK